MLTGEKSRLIGSVGLERYHGTTRLRLFVVQYAYLGTDDLRWVDVTVGIGNLGIALPIFAGETLGFTREWLHEPYRWYSG